jgi:hypothetical protein
MVELVNLFVQTFLTRICDSAMWLQLPRRDEPEVHTACQAASSKPDSIVELIATYHQRKSIKELEQAAVRGSPNHSRGATRPLQRTKEGLVITAPLAVSRLASRPDWTELCKVRS